MSLNRKMTNYRRIKDAKTAREVIDYNPDTGVFIWKKDTQNMRLAGKNAKDGLVGLDGYLTIGGIRTGRLAWLHYYGRWPRQGYVIDHINGDRTDDRIINLREVTPLENARNKPCFKSNVSGVKGVSRNIQAEKWVATVFVSGKVVYLGIFEDLDEAVCHRLAGEQCIGYVDCCIPGTASRYVRDNIQKRRLSWHD